MPAMMSDAMSAVTTVSVFAMTAPFFAFTLFLAVTFAVPVFGARAFLLAMGTAAVWACLHAMRRSVTVAFTFTAFRFMGSIRQGLDGNRQQS